MAHAIRDRLYFYMIMKLGVHVLVPDDHVGRDSVWWSWYPTFSALFSIHWSYPVNPSSLLGQYQNKFSTLICNTQTKTNYTHS